MCPRGGKLLGGQGSLLSEVHLVCHCLLLECAEHLVLVDTGFGSADVEQPRQLGRPFTAVVRPKLKHSETAVERICALGFDPADVRHIITTHLDLDHAGGLPDFPAAQVHVLAAELDAAQHPSLRDRARYIAEHWRHNPQWVRHDASGEDWYGFQGVRVLPGSDEEILMVPLAGHSAGHSGVAVRTADGWLLNCGDAFYSRGEVSSPPTSPIGLRAFSALMQADGAARRRNLERLRDLAAQHSDQVQLFCSHDAYTFDRMQRAGTAAAAQDHLA